MPKHSSAKQKVRDRLKKARRKEIAVPLMDEVLEPNVKVKPLKNTDDDYDGSGDNTNDIAMMDDNDDDEEEEAMMADSFLDTATSRKILEVAHEQQAEITKPSSASASRAVDRTKSRLLSLKSDKRATKTDDSDDDDDVGDLLVDNDDDGDQDGADVELTAEDEKALHMFMPSAVPVRQTLADIIMAKIAEKDAMQAQGGSSMSAAAAHTQLDPKVVQVYQHVGACMQKYKSGKVPKAFKVIPSLRNWEEVLHLTAPDKWSAPATYVATKLFASNLNPKMAQRFYNLVLLPKVVENIERYKRLNYHLYQAVKKAIYKPAAFFKGLFLPLVEEGCTLRVAVIMASVLSKISIPVLHSGVALIKMAQLPFSAPVALFMKTLLNKKYALPYKVIDALHHYFVQFRQSHEKGTLPVVWHQNLLTFVQRYKNHFSPVQVAAIKSLVQHHFHHQITPEIRRELFAAGTSIAAATAAGHHHHHHHHQSATAAAAAVPTTNPQHQFHLRP